MNKNYREQMKTYENKHLIEKNKKRKGGRTEVMVVRETKRR